MLLRRLRNAACAVTCAVLLCGCAVAPAGQGDSHPQLDVEVVMALLEDVDYVVTNYGWLLALLGL